MRTYCGMFEWKNVFDEFFRLCIGWSDLINFGRVCRYLCTFCSRIKDEKEAENVRENKKFIITYALMRRSQRSPSHCWRNRGGTKMLLIIIVFAEKTLKCFIVTMLIYGVKTTEKTWTNSTSELRINAHLMDAINDINWNILKWIFFFRFFFFFIFRINRRKKLFAHCICECFIKQLSTANIKQYSTININRN